MKMLNNYQNNSYSWSDKYNSDYLLCLKINI